MAAAPAVEPCNGCRAAVSEGLIRRRRRGGCQARRGRPGQGGGTRSSKGRRARRSRRRAPRRPRWRDGRRRGPDRCGSGLSEVDAKRLIAAQDAQLRRDVERVHPVSNLPDGGRRRQRRDGGHADRADERDPEHAGGGAGCDAARAPVADRCGHMRFDAGDRVAVAGVEDIVRPPLARRERLLDLADRVGAASVSSQRAQGSSRGRHVEIHQRDGARLVGVEADADVGARHSLAYVANRGRGDVSVHERERVDVDALKRRRQCQRGAAASRRSGHAD